MKKLLLSMAVAGMLFTACNGKNTEEQGHDHTDGAHQHEDGVNHATHANDSIAQEEFTVGKEGVGTPKAQEHQHESGEAHQH